MPINESSSRNKIVSPRRYEGENEASFLIAALNRETVVDPKKLPEIVDALKEIANIRSITRRRLLSGDLAIKKNQSKIDAVNAYLRQLEAVLVIALPTQASDNRVRMEWRRTRQSVRDSKQLFDSANLELAAILNAISLTQMKRIGAIRRCKKCPRWFFAKFSHSVFCTIGCKDLFHQEDPETREKKRIQAKKNYAFKVRKLK